MYGKFHAGLMTAALALAPAASVFADAAPSKDAVVTQVKKAVEFYTQNGRDKALAEFNKKDGMFAKGEDYVDVHDTSGVCVAHPVSPGIVGLNRIDQADPNGKQFIKEIVETSRKQPSGWITYQRKNPLSGKVEKKLAYWEIKDDLIFKAGTYE